VQTLKGVTSHLVIIGELLVFLWQRKLWWLIPMVLVLLLFGILMVFASTSSIAPFIYTLF
jgi:drug/metabolite transporter superfamily protein YnfA